MKYNLKKIKIEINNNLNDDVHGNENRVNKRAKNENIMKAFLPPPHYYLAIAINSILVTRLELVRRQ